MDEASKLLDGEALPEGDREELTRPIFMDPTNLRPRNIKEEAAFMSIDRLMRQRPGRN
jgi:putative ubiquitin-RnfH superfamily antitoxin RatB of RatAB toxin-antitoxin module